MILGTANSNIFRDKRAKLVDGKDSAKPEKGILIKILKKEIECQTHLAFSSVPLSDGGLGSGRGDELRLVRVSSAAFLPRNSFPISQSHSQTRTRQETTPNPETRRTGSSPPGRKWAGLHFLFWAEALGWLRVTPAHWAGRAEPRVFWLRSSVACAALGHLLQAASVATSPDRAARRCSGRSAVAKARWRRRVPRVPESGAARPWLRGQSRTMCSSPGPTGFPDTPTGWTSGFSSFSTWCCFSSCTLFRDWFADIPGSWLLE